MKILPKQNKKQQVAAQSVMSPSKAIMNGNEEFDVEAAKARILAREAPGERRNEE